MGRAKLAKLGLAACGLWWGCAGGADLGERDIEPLPFDTAAGAPAAADDAWIPPSSGTGRPSLGATPLPCDLATVLETSCQGCHAAEPRLAAPMALVSYEDLMAPAVSDPSRPVFELMLSRVHDEIAPMPPASSRRLSSDELLVIDRMTGTGPSGSDADTCGTEVPPGIEHAAPPAEDIDTCYTIAAHGVGVAGDTTPHQVEPGESYSCFSFDIPWQVGAQALTVRTHPGLAAHHVELFQMEDAAPAGDIKAQQPHCGFAPRVPISIWGLGQRAEQRMPEGVGLALAEPGAGRGLLLEVHYVSLGKAIPDQSNVEICTARVPQPQAAGISTLGAIFSPLPPGQESVVKGICTPTVAADIHIFRSFPHMHGRGRRFEATIARADGAQESLLSIDYDVNNQRTYDLDALMHPGDRLTMNCDYINDTDRAIAQGFTRDDEMCNHFVYAWPAGALAPSGSNGDTPCLF